MKPRTGIMLIVFWAFATSILLLQQIQIGHVRHAVELEGEDLAEDLQASLDELGARVCSLERTVYMNERQTQE